MLWLTNNTEGLWAKAFQMVALTLIICATSVMAHSSTGFSIGVSELNRILCQVMTFPLDQLTLKMRKKLVLLLNYGEHKLSNKPPSTDLNFAKKSSSNSQTDTYSGDSMDEIEDYLAPSIKDKKLSDAWPGIQREAAIYNHTQHQCLVRNLAVAMSRLGPIFLDAHNIKLLCFPVIIHGPNSFVGLQYGAGSFSEQNAIQIHQFRVKEARLDCLALEICACKKELEERYKQVEDFYWRKVESVNTLCAVLALVKQDEAVLNKMKKENRFSSFLQKVLATSAANAPFSTATTVFTAATVPTSTAVPTAAAVHTAASLPTVANDSALPTV